MGLTLVTPPTCEPVSLQEAKIHLRQEEDDDDLFIQSLIVAARETAQVKTGRQLLTATYDLTLDDFEDEFKIPRPPLQSITSITYIDGVGITQTLSTSIYEIDIGVEPGILRLKYDQMWPVVRCQKNAVTIRYICGWTTAALVPYSLKAWINLYVSYLYENRDLLNIGNIVNELPFMDSLLNQHKVFSVT